MDLSKDSKIFLTGASGFVGNHVLRLLVDNDFTDITCLKRPQSDLSYLGEACINICNWVEGDLLDQALLEDCLSGQEVIINIAADVTFDLRHKKKLLRNARDTTSNLVNAGLYNRVGKLIHISSVAALGRRKKSETIDENNIFSHSQYDTTYGLAKFLSEMEIWRGHTEGLPATVLCPSMILGSGNFEKSSINIFKNIYEGQRFFPTGTTGWVSVEDVAFAVLKCLTGNFSGERFIISAENLAYKDIFGRIASSLKVKRPGIALSPLLGMILWRIEKFKSTFSDSPPLLTKETLQSTSVDSLYDNSKSIKLLGMQYSDMDKTIIESSMKFLQKYAGK